MTTVPFYRHDSAPVPSSGISDYFDLCFSFPNLNKNMSLYLPTADLDCVFTFDYPTAQLGAYPTKAPRGLLKSTVTQAHGHMPGSWKPAVPKCRPTREWRTMDCEGEHQQHRPWTVIWTAAGLEELPAPADALAAFPRVRQISGVHREGLDLKAVL